MGFCQTLAAQCSTNRSRDSALELVRCVDDVPPGLDRYLINVVQEPGTQGPLGPGTEFGFRLLERWVKFASVRSLLLRSPGFAEVSAPTDQRRNPLLEAVASENKAAVGRRAKRRPLGFGDFALEDASIADASGVGIPPRAR